jgi:hypothetical protein
MFIAALFTIAKLWKQPRCITTDEWKKKMCYLCTMVFYSATKNKILSFTCKWMESKNIILSEVSQSQKAKSCLFSYADYRPKTNTAILWNTGHTKERSPTGGIGQGKETKNFNVVDVLTVLE